MSNSHAEHVGRFSPLHFATLIAFQAVSVAVAQTSAALVSVESYGNFHAGGVIATISGDSDGDASASLEYRREGEPAFRIGHPLVRVTPTRLVGSLFWLAPASSYELRITLSDPDGVSGPPMQTAALDTEGEALPEPSLLTLYVAPGGDDGNAGTDPALPLATIQHAADLAVPDTLVSIAPGVYRERVNVPTSGNATQPIVFRGSAPGAILDGADAAIAAGVAWIANGNGVYRHTTGFATGHVVSELGRLFRYDTLVELEMLGAGAPGGFFFNGTILYVKFADASSPASHVMHVARLEEGFVLDGRSYVRLENLELRHHGAGDYGKGVYLRYSSNCAVRFCRIHEIESAGVWIKGGDRNRIEGNDFWDSSIPAWPWDFTKGSSAEGNGVVLTDDVGRGQVIRYNRFKGLFNGVGPCGASGAGGIATSETDIYANTFADHNDDALEPEGFCANVRIWGNRIRDVHMAFAVAPAAPGPTWIVRNVAFDVGNTRTSQIDNYIASGIKINSGYPTPIGPLLVYHNTFFTTAPATTAIYLLNPGSSTWMQARNNVFAGTDYALYKVNPIVLDWDYDDLWTSAAGRLVRWQGTPYNTLLAFYTGTDQEQHGISQPPALANPGADDFHPQAASGLRNVGLTLPGINDATPDGLADLGAVEYDGSIFSDGFEAGWPLFWSAAVP